MKTYLIPMAVALSLFPLVSSLKAQVVTAVNWGSADGYSASNINGAQTAAQLFTQDYDFDGTSDDRGKVIPFGTLFSPTQSDNYVIPSGGTGLLYVGAQIVAYNSAADPALNIFRISGGANTQAQISNAALASTTMGLSSAFYSVKNDFLDGASSGTDLRLVDATDSLTLKTGGQFKPTGGNTSARFLVQAGGLWYVSRDAVTAANQTFAINGATALWYSYDPTQNQFLDLDNLGSAITGSTLVDITAYGVYTFSPSFSGATASAGIQSLTAFSAMLAPASTTPIPESSTLAWTCALTATGLAMGLRLRRKQAAQKD